jgi:hypothetical protein
MATLKKISAVAIAGLCIGAVASTFMVSNAGVKHYDKCNNAPHPGNSKNHQC